MLTKEVKKLDKYKGLLTTLQNELPINLARKKFIVLIINALIKVQSVNYQRLAQGFETDVAVSSNLRKIQRFFASYDLCGNSMARLLFKLLPPAAFCNGKLQLTLDRTNWKFGKKNINILMLGVIYNGLAMPILWHFLGNKRGNSSQEERAKLIERFINLFGQQHIDFITADREFIGEKWLNFLNSHKIRYFIRIRGNMYVRISAKKMVKSSQLLKKFEKNGRNYYTRKCILGGNDVYISGIKLRGEKGKSEDLIVISSTPEDAQIALKMYQKRWQIETMFKAFKTNGFHLEDTHLVDYQRIDKLLTIVSIAFIWAYKVGIYAHENIKKIKIKKHGRPEKSLFKNGLEIIAQALINQFDEKINLIIRLFLSCT